MLVLPIFALTLTSRDEQYCVHVLFVLRRFEIFEASKAITSNIAYFVPRNANVEQVRALVLRNCCVQVHNTTVSIQCTDGETISCTTYNSMFAI